MPNQAALKKMAGLADQDVPQAVDVSPAPAANFDDDVPECNSCGFEFYGDSVAQYQQGDCPACDKDPRAEDRPTGPSYESGNSQVPTPPPAISQVDTPPDPGAPTPAPNPGPTPSQDSQGSTSVTFCHGKFVGKSIELPIGKPLGRSTFKELVGKDFPGYERISGRHFELLYEFDTIVDPMALFWVRDLTSTNGTFVNGNRVLNKERFGRGEIVEIAGNPGLAFMHSNQLRIVDKLTGVCVPLGSQTCLGRDPQGDEQMHPLLRFIRTHNLANGQEEKEATNVLRTVSRKHVSITDYYSHNLTITNHSGVGTKVISGGVTHELGVDESVEVPASDCEIKLGKLELSIVSDGTELLESSDTQ